MKAFKTGGWYILFLSLIFLFPVTNYMGRPISPEPASTATSDVFLFGDSDYFYPPTKVTHDYYSPQIGGYLQSYLSHARVTQWVHKAVRMRDYQYGLQYVLARGYQPDVLIVPINWRSFSDNWLERRKRQYESQPIGSHEFYSFNSYLLPVQRIQDRLGLHWYLMKQDVRKRLKVKHEEPARLPLAILERCYPTTLSADNGTLRDLEAFLDSDEKEEGLRESIDTLHMLIADHGFGFLDLSSFIPPSGFYDDAGHLLINARSDIAREIANSISTRSPLLADN